jgi:tetratricopeptide (TPR) repeat protein
LELGALGIIILIIVFGAGLALFIIFLVKSIFLPQQISHVADGIKQGRYGQAIKVAKQIITKEPRNIEAHYLLGQAYEHDGKAELALMEYKIVNNISDFRGYCQETPFRKTVAKLYEQFDFPEEALKEYLMLMQLEPENPEIYHHAGVLFEGREKYRQAAHYFKKAIDLDPGHSDAHFHLGILLYGAKRFTDAQAIFVKAIKLDPDNVKINFYLGKIQKQVKDYPGAIAYFDKSQKDPEYKIKSIVEKGLCYMTSGNMDKAKTELERAVKLGEEVASLKSDKKDRLFARYYLAYCFENNRQIDQAIEQWEKIYSEEPGFKDVAEKLSRYQDLRSDDLVKDFMTVSVEQFQEICRAVTDTLGFNVNDVSQIPNGCQIIAVEKDSGQWRNTRKMPRLIRFVRIADNIEVQVVRDFLEDMKKMSVNRGMIISSALFSRTSQEFAESRPIELVGRDQLQELLSKSSI